MGTSKSENNEMRAGMQFAGQGSGEGAMSWISIAQPM